MKRIAVVFHNYLRGGAETIVESLCRELRQGGYYFELFTNCVADNAKQRAEQSYNRVNIYPKQIAGFGADASEAIAAAISPMKPDGIWLIGDDYDGLDSMRGVLPPGGKLVFALHSVPFFQVRLKTSSPIKRLREKFFKSYSRRYLRRTENTLEAVDSYVVLSLGYAEQLKHLFPRYADKICVINNPVLKGSEAQHPTKTIAYVGRLSSADKRVDNLLKIFRRVRAVKPDWRLRIIGDGPDRTALGQLAGQLGIADSVDFVGYQANPDLNGAQIICLTSDIEGWGMALIEGMQQGAVPIAFGCSAGVSEILADGRGVEIPPGNLQAYADALHRLMDSPELRAEIAARAKPFLDSLSVNKIAERWMGIWG